VAGAFILPVANLLATGTLYSDRGGFITAQVGRILNYVGPKPYCVWVIKMKLNQHLSISLPVLNLTCENEKVEILDGPPGLNSLGKFCESSQLNYQSTTNIVTIKCSREPSHPPSIFNVHYFGYPVGR
uniref:CUB domain-containing protein n=1 Tax=Castor canadensis TaxID=51338 RepID=A0A8C0WRE4_CASCN